VGLVGWVFTFEYNSISTQPDEARANQGRLCAKGYAHALVSEYTAKRLQEQLRQNKKPTSSSAMPASIRRPVVKQKCPQCKKDFPVDELAQHIKIELMDPRWKEQLGMQTDALLTFL
jgi:hypothetical protein